MYSRDLKPGMFFRVFKESQYDGTLEVELNHSVFILSIVMTNKDSIAVSVMYENGDLESYTVSEGSLVPRIWELISSL